MLQVHDERDPLHVRDAASLWHDPPSVHGFGDRARTHTSLALRDAAAAWPPLERLLEQRVPDELTLDTDDLVSLLEDGVAALRAVGIDVLWPRSLGPRPQRDRHPRPRSRHQREGQLVEGVLSGDALFAFNWQVALRGDPLTDARDGRARRGRPRRCSSCAAAGRSSTPSVARKARNRLIRTVPTGAGRGGGAHRRRRGRRRPGRGGGRGQPARGPRAAARRRHRPAAPDRRPGWRRPCATTSARASPGSTALTSLGLGACLADDMGLGKTVTLIALHLHRAAGAAGPDAGGLPRLPARQLGGRDPALRPRCRRTPVPRRPALARRPRADRRRARPRLRADHLRHPPARRARPWRRSPWGLVVADEAQHVKNARSATARALRTVPSAARVALTGTPVENNLTELWAILDWATPGLLGSRQAFRKVWAGPIESGHEPTKARQFAGLIGPFLLRRRKTDPGIAPELPDKTETDHLLGLTREQVVLYESFVRDTMARIERADEQTRRGLVLKLLTGLKQICNHPAHFLKQSGGRLTGRSEKLDLLDELLGTALAEDSSVLVFTQYVAMARLIEDHLARAGDPPPVPPRRYAGPAARRDGGELPGRPRAEACRSSCSRSRPAAPASTSPAPTTSSTSTAGGTPPSRTRRPTAPTGSGRRGRCRSTG